MVMSWKTHPEARLTCHPGPSIAAGRDWTRAVADVTSETSGVVASTELLVEVNEFTHFF
jgi:hypothetical protein